MQPRSWYPLVPALLAALAGAALMNSGQLSESTISPGGAFQRDAVAEAKREAAAAYSDASFRAFGVDPAAGWHFTLLAFAALAVVTGFTFGWRVRVPWWLPLSVAAVTVVVVLALPGPNCGGDDFDAGSLAALILMVLLALIDCAGY